MVYFYPLGVDGHRDINKKSATCRFMATGKPGGSIQDRQGIWKGSLCKEMALSLMIITPIHLEKRDWNWEKFWDRFDQLLWRVRCVCVCVCVCVCWDVSKIILSLRLLAWKNEQMVTPWIWEEIQERRTLVSGISNRFTLFSFFLIN